MTIVRHPTLDVEYDVPPDTVDHWVAAGWNTEGAPRSEALKMVGDQGPILMNTSDVKPRPAKRSQEEVTNN